MSDDSNIIDALGLRLNGADISTVLLSIYQCLTDPDHFTDMTGMLTSWFEAEDNPILVAHFESHSAALWETMLLEFQNPGEHHGRDSDVGTLMIEFDSNSSSSADKKLGLVLDKLCSEDVARLKSWLHESDGSKEVEPILIRYYDDALQKPHIGVFKVVAEDRVGLFVSKSFFEDAVTRLFEKNFSLSPRELDVLKALVVGNSPKEVAELQGRSLETVRTQIKSITSKLGASSQTDLVRLAGEAVAISENARSADKGELLSAHQTMLVARPGGRKIEYEVDPPTSGLPLLYFHCLTSGRHWTKKAKAMAAESGFRTIRISRASFGASSSNSAVGLELLRVHASDCASVLEREKIDRCLVFAHGMGFPSAYFFALRYPEKVIGVVGLDVPPPILSRKDASVLTGIFRTGALATLYAPSSAKLVASFAFRHLVKRDGVDLKKPLSMPHIDLTEYEDSEGCETIRLNNFDAMKNNGEGYWREATCATVDWAEARQNANNLPKVRLIQTEDNPFVEFGGICAFASQIGAPTRSIKSFLPMISGPFSAVAEELRQIMAPTI
ncbi:LuxR C-terminal-related transcriptional regulator [uncultured Ruegeria sp.]|uniref:LuxR C-terminal-related transcriptional regulator n=1 Tax=uncultured Ruegeria sp. TaxID=259304 RepID=UPI002617FC25|nr:LuxR C-terminal-related transcriptional regulator [uncultured Ruegeria sp.]